MTPSTSPDRSSIISQLQDFSHPVAVFLPGLTSKSLEDPVISDHYQKTKEHITSIRELIHSLLHEQDGTILSDISTEDEEFIFDALLLAKHITTHIRSHLIKVSAGRMQDLDYGSIKNNKYREENIPESPFVREQLELFGNRLKNFNTHHIDKRSQYGLSLPSLLLYMDSAFHNVLHMTTDNLKHEQIIAKYLVPKAEREIHSYKRRRLQMHTILEHHNDIRNNLFLSNIYFVHQLWTMPESLVRLKDMYEQRENHEQNENYQAILHLLPVATEMRNKTAIMLLDGLLESIPGYMDTAVIINTIDTKDQLLYRISALSTAFRTYEQVCLLLTKLQNDEKIPQKVRDTESYQYLTSKMVTPESMLKRGSRKQHIDDLLNHHEAITHPEFQLLQFKSILHTCTQTLPKYIPFKASNAILGQVREFTPQHTAYLYGLQEHIGQILDTHQKTPFHEPFQDLLYQPMLSLEEQIQQTMGEGLLSPIVGNSQLPVL